MRVSHKRKGKRAASYETTVAAVNRTALRGGFPCPSSLLFEASVASSLVRGEAVRDMTPSGVGEDRAPGQKRDTRSLTERSLRGVRGTGATRVPEEASEDAEAELDGRPLDGTNVDASEGSGCEGPGGGYDRARTGNGGCCCFLNAERTGVVGGGTLARVFGAGRGGGAAT
jgi:hypothetical protein